jgi:hypothetical protein
MIMQKKTEVIGRSRSEIDELYEERTTLAGLSRELEEVEKSGVLHLDAQLDAIGERFSEIDDRLEDLDVPPVDAPQKAAALILIAAIYDCQRDDVFPCSPSLHALRPLLTGQIREHVDYVAEHTGDEICTMPFYSAA